MMHRAAHTGCASVSTLTGSGAVRLKPQLHGSFNHAQPPPRPSKAAANTQIPILFFMSMMFVR
jgi:hypothetical protein